MPNFFVLQEDAVTALKLYKKYLELKSQDKLIEALNGLYDKGKACSWRTPEDDDWAGIIFFKAITDHNFKGISKKKWNNYTP